MMPKQRKMRELRRATLPSMGRVSMMSVTRMRMEGTRLMARRGRRTRIVRMAVMPEFSEKFRKSKALVEAKKNNSKIVILVGT